MSEQFKVWAKAAGIRAVKTTAQATLGALAGTALLTGINWMVVLSTAVIAGVSSLLTSLAGLPEAPKEV